MDRDIVIALLKIVELKHDQMNQSVVLLGFGVTCMAVRAVVQWLIHRINLHIGMASCRNGV